MRKKISLKKIYLIGCVVFWGASFFGPYSWKIYSVDGFILYFVFELLFFAGLCTGSLAFTNRKKIRIRLVANPITGLKRICSNKEQKYKRICLTCSAIAIVCFLYEVYAVIYLRLGSAYSLFGGQYNAEANAGRTIVDKIANFLLDSGQAAYIISHYKVEKKNRIEFVLLNIGFWAAPIFQLLMGTRFAIGVSFVIYLYLYYSRICGKTDELKNREKGKSKKIVIFLLGIILAVSFLHLYSARYNSMPVKHYTIETISEFSVNDTHLKGWAKTIYDIFGDKVTSLYLMLNAFGEAPYVFSKLYMDNFPDKLYFGAVHFHAPFQILRFLGIPIESIGVILDRVLRGANKYTGIGFALIIDFGLFGGMVMTYIFGLVFSKIEKTRLRNQYSECIYPVLIPIVLLSPIQTLYVGRSDFIILWIAILLFISKLRI